MTKASNYLIPKQNLAQIEEVRELKSEITSWEEFAKDYQGDENIAESYIAECEEWARMNGYGPGWGEWTSKLVITTAAGIVLGPAAIPAGGAIWGGSRVARNLVDDEGTKEFFGVIGDIGKDAFKGGVIGGAFELTGKALGGTSRIFADSPRVLKSYADAEARYAHLGSEMAGKLAENAAIETANKMGIEAGIFAGCSKDGFDIGKEIYKHQEHRIKGIEYDSNCKICN